MLKDGGSLNWLDDIKLDSEELAWDHAMDISGAVFRRMKELGLRKKDLAQRMGVKPARISRILSGEQSMTLRTIARLETALDFKLSDGFKNPTKDIDSDYKDLIAEFKASQPAERRPLRRMQTTLSPRGAIDV